METKSPKRTPRRILDVSLRLFNEFGEPSVTTTVISDEMDISPGNLYYHFRNKEDIINCIFKDFERQANDVLSPPMNRAITMLEVRTFVRTALRLIWQYRFLYRDLNELVSKNRMLEIQFKRIVSKKEQTFNHLCSKLAESGELTLAPSAVESLAKNLVVILNYWLSYEYVLNPRNFNAPENMQPAIVRGTSQVISLLTPHLKEVTPELQIRKDKTETETLV